MRFASAVQEAVYTALSTIDGIKVYDYVPETAGLPYIRIGDDSISRLECKTDQLFTATVSIEIFSDSKGYSELKSFTEKVEEKLELIDNASVRFLGVDGIDFTRDDEFRQATVTARFIIA